MPRRLPSVLHGLAGASVAAVVSLPLVAAGSLPALASGRAPGPSAVPVAADSAGDAAAAQQAAAQQGADAARAAARTGPRRRGRRARQAAPGRSCAGPGGAVGAGTSRGQDGQFGCLDQLWQRESEWSVGATNGSSGAHGIPQALPGSKMASAGADWRTNPVTQIRWGLQYIGQTYGSPCRGWSHSQSTGWY